MKRYPLYIFSRRNRRKITGPRVTKTVRAFDFRSSEDPPCPRFPEFPLSKTSAALQSTARLPSVIGDENHVQNDRAKPLRTKTFYNYNFFFVEKPGSVSSLKKKNRRNADHSTEE